MHPLVSVIIVSFNSIKTIQLTISSLLNQIYKNFEIIYIDGGSNDGTREYILKYLRKKDKVIFEPDYGIYDAMNKGLLHADGKYIFFLNSDDLYIDDRVISDVVEKFIQDESVDIVLGGVEYFNGSPLIRSGRKWINYTYKEGDFIHGWHPPHPGFFSKKSCYDLWGLFD